MVAEAKFQAAHHLEAELQSLIQGVVICQSKGIKNVNCAAGNRLPRYSN